MTHPHFWRVRVDCVFCSSFNIIDKRKSRKKQGRPGKTYRGWEGGGRGEGEGMCVEAGCPSTNSYAVNDLTGEVEYCWSA